MIRRTLRDVVRFYGRSWWRLGAIVALVGAVMATLLWLLSKGAQTLATHLTTTTLLHGHFVVSGGNELALGVGAAVVVVCLPVALAGVAAVVRLTDDTLGDRGPKVWRSFLFGITRVPRLFLGGLVALLGLLALVVLAPPISALGLLGLLLTGPARLVGRRWNWLSTHWPPLRTLVWMAIPLATAFAWLTRTVLLVPAATLEPGYRVSRLRRTDGSVRARGPLLVGALVGSFVVLIVLELLFTWIAFLIGSTDGRIVGQGISQFLLLALPVVVLTIIFRLSQSTPRGSTLPSSLTDPYGIGVDPLGHGFLAGPTPALMTPWRLRHRRVAVFMPIVLIATIIGLASPAGAEGDGEGGGTTPGGSATLTVNSSADDPATAPAEAPNCLAGIGTCTLRAALDEASALSGGGVDGAITVNFASSMTIEVDAGGAIPFNNGSDSNFLGTLTIDGSGHQVILDGGSSVEVMQLFSHTWKFALNNLEIRHGNANGSEGSGANVGGGLSINGPGLSTITAVTFDHNVAADAGGAIYADGSLLVQNSTFFENTAQGSAGSGDDLPGGADIYDASSVAAITANNDTFANFHGGSLFVESGSMSVNNTLFTGTSSGFDCTANGQVSVDFSGQNNVGSLNDNSCPGSVATVGGAPTIGPFQSVKAGTPPVLPLTPPIPGGPLNPAIGEAGGGGVTCPATDERGQARPLTGCDAGSFEFNSATSVTISSTEDPSAFGDAVTLTALVTLDTDVAVPKGTVQFKVDGTDAGSPVTVDGNGNATFDASALGAGTHAIVATFASALPTSYADSPPSPTFNQTVQSSGSSVGLISSENPAANGDLVSFTIQVTGSSNNAPTGTVNLSDTSTMPATVIATGVTLDGNGKATVQTSTLTSGIHLLVATYAGDANNAPGHSAALSEDIRSASTVTISPSLANITFGVPDTFTVTVPASVGGVEATGQVLVTYPGPTSQLDQLVALDGSGAGMVTLAALPVGTDDVTATYQGDTTYAASSAVTTTVSIAAATTSTGETLSPNGAVAFGVPVLVTAVVTNTAAGSGADPDGSVTFSTAGGTLGTAQLVGNGNGTSTATYTTTAGQLPEGTPSISASYVASNDFVASVSTGDSLTVTKANTAVEVVSSDNPSVFGQSIQLTATASSTGGSIAVPTGTVSFADGATVLGSVSLSAGDASFSTSMLAVGSHLIVATFTPSGSFTGSTSATLSQVVGASPSSTSLAVTPGGITFFGTTLHLTVTVMASGNGSGTPDGSVTLTDGGGTLTTLTLSGGQAEFDVTSPLVASHDFVASYQGSTNFSPSNDTVTSTVSPAATQSSLTLAPASSTFGDPVTMTDTVTDSSGGSTAQPAGTVTFSDGPQVLGTVTLTPAGATTSTAVLTTTALPETFFNPRNQLTVTATYNPSADFTTSTTSATYTVAQGTTSVTLQASAASVGVPVTLTATIAVTGGAGTPTGTVLFTDHESNGAQRNFGTVTLTGGQAVVTGILFPVGTDTVTATYNSGDANFVAGPAAVLPIDVGLGAPSLSVTATVTGSVYGQNDDLTATLAAGTGTAPTGSITFTATGPGLSVNLGSAPLSPVAPYTAELKPSSAPIPVGAVTITASYAGDANFSATTATTPAPEVTTAPTQTAVTSTQNPSVVNQPLTFTATVTDPTTGAVPVGSVAFTLGATTLGTVTLDGTGHASINTTAAVGETATMAAVYTPSSNFGGSNASLSQTVNLLPTVVTLTTNTQTLQEGGTATFTAVVDPTNLVAQYATTAPTGTVAVSDGSGHQCSITLGPDFGSPTESFGSCQITWPIGGQFTVAGTYTGDSTFASATSRNIGELVGQQTPLVSLSSSADPWITGEQFTLHWSVIGPTATDGMITVSLNGTTLCSSSQLTGSCTYTFASNYRGGAGFFLNYSGDPSWLAGSDTLTQSVSSCVPFTIPSVSPAGAGTVTVVNAPNCDGGTGYTEGTAINMVEQPSPDYSFQEWADTGSPAGLETIIATYPGPNTDEAIFDPICVSVTLQVSDLYTSGGSITSSVAPNCGPVPRNWQYTPTSMVGSFAAGTRLTLTPVTPAPQSNGATQTFYQWFGDVPASDTFTPVITLTLSSSSIVVRASFGVTCFHNITFPAPPNATASLSGPNCTDPTGPGYADQSQAIVSTHALGTQYFAGWAQPAYATATTASSSTGAFTVTKSNVTVHAFYGSCVNFNVAESGDGPDGSALGTVSATPAGSCPTQGAGWYTLGTTVDITATSVGNSDGIFNGWTGPPLQTMPSDNSSYLVVEGNGTETAAFYYGLGCQPFNTQVIPAGAGTINAAFTYGNNCPAGSYDDTVTPNGGSPAVLTLTPTSGNPVLGWTGSDTVEHADQSYSPEGFSGVNGATFPHTFLGPVQMEGWVCEAISPTITLIAPDGTSSTEPLPLSGDFIDTAESPDCPLGNLDFTVGSTVDPAALATPMGYTFTGWSGSESGSNMTPPGFVLDGSAKSVRLNATYQVVCHTLTDDNIDNGTTTTDSLTVTPAPNCPDEPASANMYIGGTVVEVQQPTAGSDVWTGWTGNGYNASENQGGYVLVQMAADESITGNFRAQTTSEKIADTVDTAGNDIAIGAKKAVGVVAAVVGGVALGLNPVTGIVGVADLIGIAVVDGLKALGVSGAGIDGLDTGLNDVAETLSFAIADLTCATVWSANANSNNAGNNAVGQVANVASAGIQANEAAEDYDTDVYDANLSYEIQGADASTEMSTFDHVTGLAGKYGSKLGVIGAVGMGIYSEVNSGPNVGWDSSASAAWTGGGSVYDSCILSSEPSYLPAATSGNGGTNTPSGH